MRSGSIYAVLATNQGNFDPHSQRRRQTPRIPSITLREETKHTISSRHWVQCAHLLRRAATQGKSRGVRWTTFGLMKRGDHVDPHGELFVIAVFPRIHNDAICSAA
jgi:hypothetical protein